MAALIPFAVNLLIGLVASTVVSGLTQLIAGTKRPSTAPTVEPPKKTTQSNDDIKAPASPLDVAPEPSGPLTGIFGSRRMGGRIRMSAKGTTTSKTFIHIEIAGAPVEAIRGLYINNRLASIDGSENVSVSPYGSGAVKVKLYDGTQVAADSATVAGVTGYTSNHKGLQLTYARVITDTSIGSNVFSGGLPDFTFQVDGFKCYDPRDVTHDINNPSTWLKTSSNPAIQSANYLIHVLGAGLPKTAIDWDSCAACANICDELVEVQPGGEFESRYSSAITWRTDEDHEVVLAKIGAAMGGGAFLVGKKYVFFAAAPPGAGVDVVPDDYEGDGISFADSPSIGERKNGVRGTFSSPFHYYEARDFPAYQDATALAADKGIEQWLDLNLEAVTSHSQAQRLARIFYKRARNGYPASVDLNFGFFDVVANDVINVTDPLAAMTAEKFRVIDEKSVDRTCQLALQRDDAAFYSWAYTDEQPFVALSPVGVTPDGSSGTGWAASFDALALIPGGGVLTDATGAAYNYNTSSADGDGVTLRFETWASPVESVLDLSYDLRGDARVFIDNPPSNPAGDYYQNTTQRVVTLAEGVATFGLGYAEGSTGFSFLHDDWINGSTVAGYKFDQIAVQVRTKNNATGVYTPFRYLCTGRLVSDFDGKVAASSPYYVLPGCRYPTISDGASGFINLSVPLQSGAQSPTIEYFVNTVDNFSTATLVGSVTNNGVATQAYAKPTAATRYFWARIANGAVKGPESNVVQVVFA